MHRGFLGAWNSISADVEKAIKAAIASNPAYSVVISGHSLGGALAELAFGSFKTQPALKISKLFTYGAPRVGDVKFANYRDGLAGATEAAEGIARRVTHADGESPSLLAALSLMSEKNANVLTNPQIPFLTSPSRNWAHGNMPILAPSTGSRHKTLPWP